MFFKITHKQILKVNLIVILKSIFRFFNSLKFLCLKYLKN